MRGSRRCPALPSPYLADATAGEDTSVQWRTAASPSAHPPPECARIRSPLSAGLSPLRLEKHSVLQLGERRPHSDAGRAAACCARTAAPPLQPPAPRIRPNTPEIRSPLSTGLCRRIEKHSVLQLGGARRPHSAAGRAAACCARTAAPPSQPPAARIRPNTLPIVHRSQPAHREALGAAAR